MIARYYGMFLTGLPPAYSSLKTKLDEISFENAQLRKKAGVTGEGETSTTMKPTFLLSEIETLRQKVESAQTRVHDLEQELLEASCDCTAVQAEKKPD